MIVKIGLQLLFHQVPVFNIPAKLISISNSADILRYLYGTNATDDKKSAYLKPTPEALEWEKKFDKMGIDIRRYAYYHIMFKSPIGDEALFKTWGLYVDGVPQWQKALLKVLFPVLKQFLVNALNVNPEGAEDGLRKSRELFAEVDALLKDGRKFILNTDEPTFVDVTFASLGAILAIPDNYGNTALNEESRLNLSWCGVEFQKAVKEFRKTPSGKFVLRMFKDYRQATVQ